MRTSIHNLKWGLFTLIEGDFISQFARTYGEWSEVEVSFFHSILSNDSNVIEVGANIGMHAVPIAKKIPQGKLFCFEPQRIIFQTLCANLALNNLTNVHAYNQGVSHEQSLIEIPSSDYNTDWNYGSFSLDKGFDTENKFEGIIHKEYIYLTSIDNHPEIQKLPSLKLLKIDAEGFELNVLHGARSTIAKYLPVIFVEAHIHQSQELIHYLNALDYECYWFISDRYQENNHFKQARTISGLDFNLACFHKSQQSTLPEALLTSRNPDYRNIPLVSY